MAGPASAAMVIGVVQRERKAQSAPASLRRLTCSFLSILLVSFPSSKSRLIIRFLAEANVRRFELIILLN